MEDLPDDTGHSCELCAWKMDEKVAYTFDNLEELENSLTIDTKNSLVHIAGYARRKDKEMSEEELFDCTTLYAAKYQI